MSAALQNIGKHLGSKVAFVLEVLFWQPQKSKNTTLLPSYWIYSFGPPKKQKHNPSALLLDLLFWQPPPKKNWCPRIGFAFSKATKKKKHNPFAMHKRNPCASCWICFFGGLKKAKTACMTRSWPDVPFPPDAMY